jgi:tripeptidyl-peptidase-1
LVKPSDETSDLVHQWLASHGYGSEDLGYSPARDWLKVTLLVEDAERLLNTEYSVFKHQDGSELIRTPEWSLPVHLHKHVDAIQPTNSFFRIAPLATTWLASPAAAVQNEANLNSTSVAIAQALAATVNPAVAQVCNASRVTTDCLRTIYGTKDYVPKVPAKSRIGYCNYLGETTIQSDLDLWTQTFRSDAQGAKINFELVNGGLNNQNLDQATQARGTDTEANLDGQSIVGITYPIPVVAYNTGGQPPITQAYAPPAGQPNTNEPYLDWVQYILAKPDSDIPPTISTSYGEDEQSVPKDYATRVCQDFAQLGSRGVTLLFSSGDSGVGNPSGPNGQCLIYNDPNNPNNGSPNFLPAFPAGCPYVTAVGGTRGLGTSASTLSGAFNTEVAAGYPSGMSKYSSGGGFSNYFPRPSWQESAVEGYISKISTEVDPSMYNKSGRAYPDLAANGQSYAVFWAGRIISVDGTSASAPTMAAVIALLNDDLLAAKKAPLGFLNPWLYQTGNKGFTDITSGSAVGCGGMGFPAKEGWDAVTGFGTPVCDSHDSAIRIVK